MYSIPAARDMPKALLMLIILGILVLVATKVLSGAARRAEMAL